MSSAAISCDCGRPIAPVFGAWPEECAGCALKIAVFNKEGRAAFEEILEQARTTLRRLAVAASVSGNVWRVDGLELRSRFQMLDSLEAQVISRQRMWRVNTAQRLSEQKTTQGKTTNEIRRTSLGHMWNSVTPERATELKKSGFEVRYIGVAWQVKVS